VVRFLEKWTSSPPGGPRVAVVPKEAQPAAKSAQTNAEPVLEGTAPEREARLPWAEWKAASINRIFREQGVTGQLGRITAETIQHGEADRERKSGGVSTVDSASTTEQPMSRAEATE
jgi:hypothetical protein